MKILLIGEYNRSHHFLKNGLTSLGHEVLVVGLGDGFKKVTVDILLEESFKKGFLKKIKNLLYLLFKIDLTSIHKYHQIKKLKPVLSNYDIVQFINENSFLCTPKYERKIFNLIKKWNRNLFLLSCGTDYISVKYAYDRKFKYSILSPYFEMEELKHSFKYILKYIQPNYFKLHQHIYTHIKGVIASDFDYDIPLVDHPKYLGMIPNPVNIETLSYPKKIMKNGDPIVIFHGFSKANYYKKGNYLFDKALDIISSKYKSHVKIIRTTNLPYEEYIKSFDSCHILLDQVYAYDQGFNALEAMAKEKVVFTGAEQVFLDYYQLSEDQVCINALPDINQLVEKLEWLINNPSKIEEIGKNARQFVLEHHNHQKSAETYLKKWTSVL